MRLSPATTAEQAKSNCIASRIWEAPSQGLELSDDERTAIEVSCSGTWTETEGVWKQTPIDKTTTSVVATAGVMKTPTIVWVLIGALGLYYAYSKGVFKKILK